MSIQVSSSINQPQIDYNKVFLVKLLIEQVFTEDNIAPPKHQVFIQYRLYGILGSKRYFHPEFREISISDYVSEGIKQLSIGDNTLLQALPSIEAAVSSLVAADMGTTTQVI